MMWMPSIIKASGNVDIVSVGWLAAIPYFVAIAMMLIVSFYSDKLQNRKLFVWPLLLIATIAFFTAYLLGAEHFWICFILLSITAGCMHLMDRFML